MKATPKYVLVTPVWNDSDRLEVFGRQLAVALNKTEMNIEWIIADDGSSLAELNKLENLLGDFSKVYENVSLVSCSVRSRKGGAIRQAWDKYPDADYYCFVDGDGAIAADIIIELMRAVNDPINEGISIVGVRQITSSKGPVERTFLRRLFFRVFLIMVHTLLKHPWLDTQCGAKVIDGSAYRSIRSSLHEVGFVFDAELLTRLNRSGFSVKEVAIAWREVQGSKLCLVADSCRIVLGLLRIRRRM